MRKILFAVGILFFVWLLFGQIVPQLLFTSTSNDTAAPVAADNNRLADLSARVDHLEARLKTFEEMMAALPKPADNPELQAKIAEIQARMDALQRTPPAVAGGNSEALPDIENKLYEQDKTLDDLKEQLGKLRSTGDRQLATITVFGQLKEALRRGDPFADLLSQLTSLTQNQPIAQDALKQLAPFAEKGLVTLPELQRGFDATVPHAMAPEASSSSFMNNLRSLIRVRKVGEQAGTDDQAVLARAEMRLAESDVTGSLKELELLSPPAANGFTAWTSLAQTYVHVNELADTLQRALVMEASPAATAPHPSE